MNISTETREILRNYKAVINARRREMGQKPLTTAQIVDEICDFAWQISRLFSSAVTTSFRAAETGDTGQAVEAACQPARKPRQADACRKCGVQRLRRCRPSFSGQKIVYGCMPGNRCDIP